MIPFPLSCVTHSLSFPFTLLFRSRPFSPSYVPALFHFPTLCELLRTRHVFNELQVARSDSFSRVNILGGFLTSACVSAHTIACGILYSISFFPLFSSLFFSSFNLSLLPYCASGRVGTLRSSDGTSDHFSRPGVAPRLVLRACAISSRLLFSSGPSQYLVLGSTMRITSNRNAAALLNRRPS